MFVGVDYYDGQAFLAPKSRGLQSTLELDGAEVCVQAGTTTEPNAIDYFKSNHMKYTIIRGATSAETLAAYGPGNATTDERPFRPVRAAPAIAKPQRSRDPAGGDLERAARTRGAAGRHAMVQYRQMGQFRDDRRRGTRREFKERRRHAEVAETRRWANSSASKATSASGWACPTTGPPICCAPSATTERASSATSAFTRSSVIPRGLNELWNNGGIQYAPPIR